MVDPWPYANGIHGVRGELVHAARVLGDGDAVQSGAGPTREHLGSTMKV